jgi:biotin carboxyl carrier protein
VEHTVTEEVTGVDLVSLQLDLAEGRALAELGFAQSEIPAPRGYAIQLRVNTEKLRAKDGLALPASGTLTAFEPPEGPGVRTDTAGHPGYASNPRFDSLLAKVIVHSPSKHFADLLPRAQRALAEFRIEGIETNRGLLLALLRHPALAGHEITTRFVEEHSAELVAAAAQPQPRLYYEPAAPTPRVGAAVDPGDPLAVLAHGKSAPAPARAASAASRPGAFAVRAPLQGTVASFAVGEGDTVTAGRALLVLEAMKMEHVIEADRSGIVRGLAAAPGETVAEGQPLVWIEEAEVATTAGATASRRRSRADPARPRRGRRAARARLRRAPPRRGRAAAQDRPAHRARERRGPVRPGSFLEYGPLAIAAQRPPPHARRPDGAHARRRSDRGIGSVNGDLFPASARAARCSPTTTPCSRERRGSRTTARRTGCSSSRAVAAARRDLHRGRRRPARRHRWHGVAGLDCTTFHDFGALSGLVPLVAINSGRCFAGNAALLGCCDVVIATANSNIGMGGPAMIEGGGLGVFRPEEVGPIDVQVPNGVVDLPVEDEAEAVALAKRYLAYFQGSLPAARARIRACCAT